MNIIETKKSILMFSVTPGFRLSSSALSISFLVFLAASFLFSSCVSHKKGTYLNDIDSSVPDDSLIRHVQWEYVLKPGDVITVEIRSIEPSVTEIFDPQGSLASAGQFDQAGEANYFNGYRVDENGDIEMPLIGLIEVGGRTTIEAKRVIESSASKYINSPFVAVRLGGIRYATLGEFNSPGRHLVLQSRLTIFEAIANAGDLTVFADRTKLSLIRQYADGQKIHIIDLTDRGLISSEFYYVQPGDQLYAEPLRTKRYFSGPALVPIAFLGVLSSILLFSLLNN